MKREWLVGGVVLIVLVGIFLWQIYSRPSIEEIDKRIPGNWSYYSLLIPGINEICSQKIENNSLEAYHREALLLGLEEKIKLEDNALTARLLLRELGKEQFSTPDKIYSFLKEKGYGDCRDRAALGYWLLSFNHPESDIWLVMGYLETDSKNPEGLDINHVWLEKDGEIVEVTFPQKLEKEKYHDYVLIQAKRERGEWTILLGINLTAIEEDWESDYWKASTLTI